MCFKLEMELLSCKTARSYSLSTASNSRMLFLSSLQNGPGLCVFIFNVCNFVYIRKPSSSFIVVCFIQDCTKPSRTDNFVPRPLVTMNRLGNGRGRRTKSFLCCSMMKWKECWCNNKHSMMVCSSGNAKMENTCRSLWHLSRVP